MGSFLREDLGPSKTDITTKLIGDGDRKVKAIICCKQKGILAGCDELAHCLKKLKIAYRFHFKDGDTLKKGDHVIELKGKVKDILIVERFIMNLLQRMCGIATKTKEMISKMPKETLLCSTRKTYLGLIDKKAVVIGGGGTHRLGLWDIVLIKENHIKSSSIEDLIQKLYKMKSKIRFAEIEANNTKEVRNILNTIADSRNKYPKKNIPWIIMLDNFRRQDTKAMIELIHKHKCLVELSGNINEKNIKDIHHYKPNIVSSGSITHSVSIIDFSLKIC